ATAIQLVVNMKHRDFHDIARSALDRHIYRFTFSCFANIGIAIGNARKWTNTTIDRTHISMFACSNGNLFHVTPDALVSVVIVLDHFLGFLPADTNSLRKSPWLYRVGNRKVNYL